MYEEFRPTPPVRRTTRLRHMLTGPGLEFLMEAHNGVSAKIVGEAGFQGLWASGLTMSASFGVRDNNELSWSQVVDQAGFMADAASIPILLDGDTGHGNSNNMRRSVRKLEQAGVAGVDAPFEAPLTPDLVIDRNADEPIDVCVDRVMQALAQ